MKSLFLTLLALFVLLAPVFAKISSGDVSGTETEDNNDVLETKLSDATKQVEIEDEFERESNETHHIQLTNCSFEHHRETEGANVGDIAVSLHFEAESELSAENETSVCAAQATTITTLTGISVARVHDCTVAKTVKRGLGYTATSYIQNSSSAALVASFALVFVAAFLSF